MDARQRTTFGNGFRFAARVLGLSAGLAAVAGAVWLYSVVPVPDVQSAADLRAAAAGVVGAARGDAGDAARGPAVLALAGAGVVALWGLLELAGGLALSAGRKTAAGSLNVAQIVLAVALLGVVNAVGFGTYKTWDFSRDGQFTLGPDQADQLRQLRTDAPTTVVVLQLHKTAGTLSDKPDAYDYAAERKVVEKVRDLVGQLREFGPQFNVAVLDVEDEGYERKLRDLGRKRPGLAEAVRDAPENSIFFYADGKVRREPRAAADKLTGGSPRPAVAPDPDDAGAALVYPAAVTRMSFTEFYQLDKTASRSAGPAEREGLAAVLGPAAFGPAVPGRGNLVLIPQGKEAFVRKVLAVEERRPRVALAVIHPYLTSRENFDEYSAAGLRRSLEANGFEVADVILKRWGRGGAPSPAAYTYEESDLERVENRYALFTSLTAARELQLGQLKKVQERVDKATPAELDRMLGRQLGRPIRTAADKDEVRRIFADSVQLLQEELAELARQRTDLSPRYQDLLRDERAAENRRVTDIKAKLRQYVADCDLLIVPRLTTLDVSKGEIISPKLFDVSKEQAEVVKEFVKAGKPVLFALGPTNVERRGVPGSDAAGDDVEALLPRLGVELGRQTVLTDKEGQAMAERQAEALGSTVDVPPLVFDLPDVDGKKPNPVGAAFRTTARAVDRKLDVKRSGYRPVYLAPGFAGQLPYAADVMSTVRESWNEDRPMPDDEYTPKFDPPKPDAPRKANDHDAERRGPFPVGLALEVPVPVEWLDKADLPAWAAPPGFADAEKVAAVLPFADGGLSALGVTLAADRVKRPTVRVAVFGHGGLFTGKKLDPGPEALLLHTLNWELRRADRLPKDAGDEARWRFPRSTADAGRLTLWRWGAVFGLPLLTAWAGLVVLMARKVR